MISANNWTRCLIVACLLATGCQPNANPGATNSSEDGGTAISDDAKSGPKKIVPVKRDVKEIEGNWVVVVSNKRPDSKRLMDNYRWIIKFSRSADGKIAGEFIDTVQDPEQGEKSQVISTSIDGDAVNFEVKTPHGNFDFNGTFQQGFIRGTVRSGPTEILMTRLLPTDEKSLQKYSFTGSPPGTDVFEALFKSKDLKPEQLMAALREFRTSPLTQEIYMGLLAPAVQSKMEEAKLTQLIDECISSAKVWGARWEARMEYTVATSLIQGRQFSRLAFAHLDAAEKLLGSDLNVFQGAVGALRESANINVMVQDMTSNETSDEQKATDFTQLLEVVKKQPYNAEILHALAVHAQRTGQTDAAIEYLSKIVALPLLEATVLQSRAGLPPDTASPSDALKKLWTEKHGSEDGYVQHVNEVYHAEIDKLISDVQQQVPLLPADSLGNKNVLVELFTGTQCPPCVGTDISLMGISKSYPDNHVIVIRFHQHIPMPDGLVNQDSEDRATFYDVSSTPFVTIDGFPIDARFCAGPLQAAPNGYGVLRRMIDSRVTEKTETVIQLKADVTDGQLSASAEVTGIPEDVLRSCRLRLAVVENRVTAFVPLATNGIREHEFVVREMLGGAKGIPPKKGELKYSVTIPLADINQRVMDYVSRFEAGRRAEFPAAMKPPIQGPLSLVAWVQIGIVDKDMPGKRVLQAVVVPIAGSAEARGLSQQTPAGPPANSTDGKSAASQPALADDQPPPPAVPE